MKEQFLIFTEELIDCQKGLQQPRSEYLTRALKLVWITEISIWVFVRILCVTERYLYLIRSVILILQSTDLFEIVVDYSKVSYSSQVWTEFFRWWWCWLFQDQVRAGHSSV